MAVCREPSFAPIMAVLPFDTLEEALQMDAQCPFALGASVFTANPSAVEAWAGRLRTGSVTVNDVIVSTAHPATPFGGRGESGWGVTQGAEGLLEMTVPQVLSVRGGRYRPHYDLAAGAGKSQAELVQALLDYGHGATWWRRLGGLLRVLRAMWRGYAPVPVGAASRAALAAPLGSRGLLGRCREPSGTRSPARLAGPTGIGAKPQAAREKTLMSTSVFDRLQDHLRSSGIAFTFLFHEPVYTSEQAAAVRGVPLASGAKALVLKTDDKFVMVVVPADRKLDSKKARTALGSRSLRLATREEVEQITGLQPGSIPPFGSLFGLPTWCDPALGESASINFNAGDHAISVQMAYTDYTALEQPTLADLT